MLEPNGVPFLRIDPQGVLGNLDAPSWYTTSDPAGSTLVPDDVLKRY